MSKYQRKPTQVDAIQVKDLISRARSQPEALGPWVHTALGQEKIVILTGSVLIKGVATAQVGYADCWVINHGDLNLDVMSNEDFLIEYVPVA